MKLPSRTKAPALPGLHGPVRVERRVKNLLPRLREGDIAVLDHLDLDRTTAQALVDAGVRGVVNAAPFISGRYANLGPELLAKNDIVLVDQIGAHGLAELKDGAKVRLHEGTIYSGEQELTSGRSVDAELIAAEMDRARTGLAIQLESFTNNSAEFVRREQDLILNDLGGPELSLSLAGRPVVVCVHSYDWATELKAIKPFIAERDPILIGVGAGASALASAGHQPHIIVVDAQDTDSWRGLSSEVLQSADDVVAVAPRGAGEATAALAQLERSGANVEVFATTALAEDAALLLTHLGDACLVVGVGMSATLDEFLDNQRAGLASTFLTRLKLGPRLVDASVVPDLYSGTLRLWHVLVVVLAGLLALAVAIAVTPTGQQWTDHIIHAVTTKF